MLVFDQRRIPKADRRNWQLGAPRIDRSVSDKDGKPQAILGKGQWKRVGISSSRSLAFLQTEAQTQPQLCQNGFSAQAPATWNVASADYLGSVWQSLLGWVRHTFQLFKRIGTWKAQVSVPKCRTAVSGAHSDLSFVTRLGSVRKFASPLDPRWLR